jgi:HD-GYP domain-containing protein (c-di-GMP phosphodiesterase class II)
MLTKRVYRDALSFEQAFDEIRRGRGTDFCASCADALDEALARGLLSEITPLATGAAA